MHRAAFSCNEPEGAHIHKQEGSLFPKINRLTAGLGTDEPCVQCMAGIP